MSPQLKMYWKRKESNLCVTCGKVPPVENKAKCYNCNILCNKVSKKQKAKRVSGICRQCLIRPIVDNLSSCHQCRERGRKKSAEQYKKIRIDVLNLYGGKCVCCDNDNLKYLQLDHKNNDGNIERANLPATLRGGRFFKYVLQQYKTSNKKRDDLQILCANCHNAKRYGGCTKEDHL